MMVLPRRVPVGKTALALFTVALVWVSLTIVSALFEDTQCFTDWRLHGQDRILLLHFLRKIFPTLHVR